MARRVRQTSSRGSKKRLSPVLPKGAPKQAQRASARAISQSSHSDGAEAVVSLQVESDVHRERNDERDWRDGDIFESQINSRMQTNESSQPVADSAIFPPMDSGGGEILAESFDEEGYLRLNPDLRRAIELGEFASGYSHYLSRGRSEGRALADAPGEARNVMHAASRGATRADLFPKESRCSVEDLIIAVNAGLMIVGWIDDEFSPLNCLRIIGPELARRARCDTTRESQAHGCRERGRRPSFARLWFRRFSAIRPRRRRVRTNSSRIISVRRILNRGAVRPWVRGRGAAARQDIGVSGGGLIFRQYQRREHEIS